MNTSIYVGIPRQKVKRYQTYVESCFFVFQKLVSVCQIIVKKVNVEAAIFL